jgi:MoaA/NifB/PqqE/SkfB family radical SAM enzyme
MRESEFLHRMLRNVAPTRAPAPREVFIETTRACNLRCAHCGVIEPGYRADVMKPEVFERLLPFLRRYRPKVSLNGHGETLTHPRFLEMFRTIVDAGCRVAFQSNGQLLTPDLTRQLFEIAGDRFAGVVLSLDAATPQLYEEIRRRGRFDVFLTNARALGEEARRRHLGPNWLCFEMVAMRKNMQELAGVVKLVHDLGSRLLMVADLIEYSTMRGQAIGSHLAWARPHWKEAKAVAHELGVTVEVTPDLGALLEANDELLAPPSPVAAEAAKAEEPIAATADVASAEKDQEPQSKQSEAVRLNESSFFVSTPAPPATRARACDDPWRILFVQAKGEVVPCCVFTLPLGNVADIDLARIWHSPRCRVLRRSLGSPTPLPICRTCFIRGWRPTSAATRARIGIRRLLGRLTVATSSRWRLRPSANAARLLSGETAALSLSIDAPLRFAGRLVDVYLELAVGETRYFISNNGPVETPTPYFASWEPFSFADLTVLRHPCPAVQSPLTVEVVATVVPAGQPMSVDAPTLGKGTSTFVIAPA